MYQIIQNGTTHTPPRTVDGSPLPYALDNGEYTWFADNHSQLLGALIPGYEKLGEDRESDAEALRLRTMYAIEVAAHIQADMNGQAGPKGDIDALTEDDIQIIMADKSSAVAVTGWNHRVPLVLVDVLYQPYRTEPPAPQGGTVVWVKADDELSLIRTIHDLGLCVYGSISD